MAEVFDAHQQWFDDFHSFLVGGKVYYGKPNTDPTILENQIPVFANRALTVNLPNPQTIGVDGRVENKPWLDQRYSIEVYDEGDVLRFSSEDTGENPSTGPVFALSNVQGINNITAETPEGITEYRDQQVYTMAAVAQNTDDMTINIDELGPRPFKFNFNEQIKPGFIQENQPVTFIYLSATDTFYWIDSGRGISLLTDVAGDGDDITAEGGPSTINYIDKQIYIFRATAPNTQAVTLKVGTLPVVPLKKHNNAALVANEILANQDVIVSYNSTSVTFQVISQLSNQFFIQPKMCIPFFDVAANIPAGYVVCDGTNGTPNLVNGRYARAADNTGDDIGDTGGSTTTGSHVLTVTQMPSHSHTFTASITATAAADDNGTPHASNPVATNTGNTGGGGGHTHPGNEPPFTNVLWIMKT